MLLSMLVEKLLLLVCLVLIESRVDPVGLVGLLRVVKVLECRDSRTVLVSVDLPELGHLGGNKGDFLLLILGVIATTCLPSAHGELSPSHGALDENCVTLQVLVQ